MNTKSKCARVVLNERARRLAQPAERDDDAGTTLEVITFALGDERYALESLYVREVVPLAGFTRIPGAPELVVGLINFRGESLAIFDLRKLLRVEMRPISDQSRVIVLGGQRVEFGIVADEVYVVTTLSADAVLDPAGFQDGKEFCRGVTNDAVILLDGAALLADERLVVDQR